MRSVTLMATLVVLLMGCGVGETWAGQLLSSSEMAILTGSVNECVETNWCKCKKTCGGLEPGAWCFTCEQNLSETRCTQEGAQEGDECEQQETNPLGCGYWYYPGKCTYGCCLFDNDDSKIYIDPETKEEVECPRYSASGDNCPD